MTATPILLVAGHLGAGKTSLVNRLLREAAGTRIAAIVNDFGDIDIDAALLQSSSEELVSLKNGCICCSLQGDLLRTLAAVVRRTPAPDAIVIETSGIADPAEIIRSLLDPVIFKAAALDTVLTLVDGLRACEDPQLWHDPLWLSQLRSADMLLVTKADLVGPSEAKQVAARLGQRFPSKPVFVLEGALPMELMFGHGPGELRTLAPPRPSAPAGFETLSWTARRPLSLAKFQAALGPMSRKLLRAKGFVSFEDRPSQSLVFQLVGSRATLTPAPAPPADGLAAAIVLIARQEVADLGDIAALLDEAVTS